MMSAMGTGDHVLAIGELLWDVFPDAERLGGAPFNVVANLRRLGHPAKLITAVGRDRRGRDAIAAVAREGVDTDLVEISATLPTGTAVVALDASGTPEFEIISPAAYEDLALDADALARVARWRPRALVYGTLAQGFPAVAAATERLLEACDVPVRLYDLNLRPGRWTPELVRSRLAVATIVKLNASEAKVLAGMLGTSDRAGDLGERLAHDHGLEALCITRGPDGAALWRAGTVSEAQAPRVAVADTVGAGDAFAAGLLHGVLGDAEPRDALELGLRLGALVASRPGALPSWTQADLDVLAHAPSPVA